MPDLLTHVLLAYTVTKLLASRLDWLTPQYVTLALVGVFLPDLLKIGLVVDEASVSRFLGLPFSWQPLQTASGVTVAILLGTVLFEEGQRRRVAALLSLGAVTHLVADAALLTPSGRTAAFLWPLTRYHFPTPGLYLSTEVTPLVVAGVAACAVALLTSE